ncbi:MAG: transcriptional regulator [Phycisphaerales bacterium]
MKDTDFQQKLGELLAQIERAPESERGRLRELAQETKDRHERMRAIIGDLQDSLDHLRLSVKYLVFDLEATRRENTYLRKMLDSNRDDAPGGAD